MGPTWGRPRWAHVGHVNLAVWGCRDASVELLIDIYAWQTCIIYCNIWCIVQRYFMSFKSVQLRHNEHDCLLNGFFRRRTKKTSKLCVTGLCEGNPPLTGGFSSQRASRAENVSIWWRHHETDVDTYFATTGATAALSFAAKIQLYP